MTPGLLQQFSAMTTASSSSPFQELPEDVLRRLLAGVPFLDHGATAAACRAFRAVIKGSQFLALRRRYGFEEHDIVLVGCRDPPVKVRLAHFPEKYPYNNSTVRNGVRVDIPGAAVASAASAALHSCSTTDGGTRLFVCTMQERMNVWAVDISSRVYRHFATLPRSRRVHCMEWHGGCLYIAGGVDLASAIGGYYLDSLRVFNEATDSSQGSWDSRWENLPPMPHACMLAASGVIGNQLFIAGGHAWDNELSTLQIYDFTSRTWRLGAPLPEAKSGLCGVVCDAKLFVIRSNANNMYVYDPEFDKWTVELNVPSEFWYFPVQDACNHKGRVVVFLQSGTTSVRLAPGHWYLVDLCEDANELVHDNHNGNRYVAESALLG